MAKIEWKKLIPSVLLPIAVGALAGFLSRDGMQAYGAVVKPPLSPPDAVFPIVWTLLYALMGISAYLVVRSDAAAGVKRAALIVYFVQLALNFCWPLVFFDDAAYFAAFVVLMALFIAALAMTLLFASAYRKAGLLQLPYLAWLVFAAYLNFAVYLLNT